jgi:ABC-type dipeptide/oligopeptide/nickel transport system permease component
MNLVLRRVLGAIPLTLVAVIITFVLGRIAPGDPISAMLENGTSPEVADSIRSHYGLDRPILEQLWIYLGELLRGNLGISYSQGGLPVMEIIGESWLVSLQLGLLSMLIMLGLGVPLGIVAAANRGRAWDWIIRGFVVIGTSVPSFVIAYAGIWWLGVQLNLLPIGGWGTWQQAILPPLVLGLPGASYLTRQTRSALLDALSQDYIRTANAKGLSRVSVLTRHALRNSLLPVVTLVGPVLGTAVGGFFIVENIFSIPGMGRLSVQAVYSRDYPLLQAIVLLLVFSFVTANLLVDMAYAWIDPRIHHRKASRAH